MIPILQTVVVAVITLGTGASAVSVMNRDMPDLAVPVGAWQPGSTLDGSAFNVTGTVVESGEILPETVLSFTDGKFQSSRCQIYCDFGWNAYETWREAMSHISPRRPHAPKPRTPSSGMAQSLAMTCRSPGHGPPAAGTGHARSPLTPPVFRPFRWL
jgi:hypothetical protein